jgi:hypothetical protein
MAEEFESVKRTVRTPMAGVIGSGELLSVELGPDEEVEWTWSHDPVRGSIVTGYTIVSRKGPTASGSSHLAWAHNKRMEETR